MAHDPRIYSLETDTGQALAKHVEVADTLSRRALGLMFRRGLLTDHGLVIKPCNSIHMFFMRFAIDVAFVDGDGVVLHACEEIKPWRISRIVRHSKAAIELEPGVLRRAGVAKGTRLSMVASD